MNLYINYGHGINSVDARSGAEAGSFEFKGPNHASGYETNVSLEINRYLSLNSGATKIGNAFFKGGHHRVYVIVARTSSRTPG